MQLTGGTLGRSGTAALITTLVIVLMVVIAASIPAAPIERSDTDRLRGYLVGHSSFSAGLARLIADDGYNCLVIDLTTGEGGLWKSALSEVAGRRFPTWGWIELDGSVELAARQAAQKTETARRAAEKRFDLAFKLVAMGVRTKLIATLREGAPSLETVGEIIDKAIERALAAPAPDAKPDKAAAEEAVAVALEASVKAAKLLAGARQVKLPGEHAGVKEVSLALDGAALVLTSRELPGHVHAIAEATTALRAAIEVQEGAGGKDGETLADRAASWGAAAQMSQAIRRSREALSALEQELGTLSEKALDEAIDRGITALPAVRANPSLDAPALHVFAMAVDAERTRRAAAKRAAAAAETSKRASAAWKLKHVVPELNLAGLYLYGPDAAGVAARLRVSNSALRVIPVVRDGDDEPEGEHAVAMDLDAFLTEAASVQLPILLADQLDLASIERARAKATGDYLVARIPLLDRQ